MTIKTKQRGFSVRFIRDNILEKNASEDSLRLDTTRIGNIIGLIGMVFVFVWAITQENLDFETLIKNLAGPGFLMTMYQAKKFSSKGGG